MAEEKQEPRYPRPLWNGAIVFGLVTIPIGLYTATRDRSVHFHLMTKDGTCRLRRKLFCPETGKEYEFSDTARGYEIAPDQYVVVEPEEIDSMKPESGETLELQKFVDGSEIDPLLFRTTYYLLPGKNADKPFILLREALKASGRVGIGTFIMREKEYLAAIRAKDDLLTLHTLFFNDEIVSPSEVGAPEKEKLTEKERALANQLVESLTDDFKYSDYHDEYREQLAEMLEKRAKGGKIKRPAGVTPTPPSGTVVDLMERLQESLKKAKKSRKRHKKAA